MPHSRRWPQTQRPYDRTATIHSRSPPRCWPFEGRTSEAVVGIAPERVDHLLGEPARWELPLALLAWSVVVIGAVVTVALRTAEATADMTLDLPLLAAQLCMLAMAVLPLLFGAAALLGTRRLLDRLRM